MKSVIRIFNFIIMGISAVAMLLLFTTSTFTFNSRISVDNNFISDYFNNVVGQINDSIDPGETDPVLKENYINTIDITHVLGTDHINLSIACDLNFGEVGSIMGKEDRDLINQELISNNVQGVFNDLHEPVEILTEYTARTVLRGVAKKEVYKQLKKSLQEKGRPSSPSDVINIMEEVGMNDNYFRGFAKALYDASNTPDVPDPDPNSDKGCSVDTFIDTIIAQLETVIDEAEEVTGGAVDTDAMIHNPDLRDQLKSGFISVVETAGLLKDSNTFIKISQASYVLLAKTLKDLLSSSSSIDPHELDQKPGESQFEYASRLTELYVNNMLPPAFYQIIGYVCLGLFIGILLFAIIWGILILLTLLRTLSKDKPWTIFGPWFWIVGSLQIVLGLFLTVFAKFYLPGLQVMQNALAGSPIQSFAIAPRTSVLVPSIIFIVMIVFAIVYTIMAHPVKREYKDKRNGRGPKPKEVVIHE